MFWDDFLMINGLCESLFVKKSQKKNLGPLRLLCLGLYEKIRFMFNDYLWWEIDMYLKFLVKKKVDIYVLLLF